MTVNLKPGSDHSPATVSLETAASLPANFTLACYRLTLQALESLQLPAFKGSALRGGFGHTFKRLVCVQPRACDKHCHAGNICPYGYIFETTPPENSEVLRNFQGIPRPFVIQSPAERRSQILSGEQLSFGLTLVGHGINYLPYFIAVFRQLGQVGLGRNRGRYRLLTVEAVRPDGEKTEPIYHAETETIRTVEATINSESLAARAAILPPDRLTIDFLTPTRLRHKGIWIHTGPSFQALAKVLLGRISSLSYFHCGQHFEADFRGLIDRAAGVQIAHSETRWEDWSRFSGRQKQRVRMGGLMGRVTYEGDLQDYLPLLALGELVHVGKGTVFGNGQYHIGQTQEDTNENIRNG